jgi:sulfide:quinone oxidoreductase
MESNGQKRARVLVAGGGVASLAASLALQELATGLVDVEVIAPDSEFTYRPLAVAEPFRAADLKRFPLRTLVERAGAKLRAGTVAQLDAPRSRIRITAPDGDKQIPYEFLLLALGAQAEEAVPNALTFRGPQDIDSFQMLLDEMLTGEIRRIAFAVPAGVAWPLPLYELALLTANYAAEGGTRDVEISIVTPEQDPLGIFGSQASDAVRELLEIRGVHLHTHTTPVAFAAGKLDVAPQGTVEADRVVALPRLRGAALPGVPHDQAGFVPVDRHARVHGLGAVYAAGDMTQFPIKQGGIAAQQADAAAESIAAAVGAEIEPSPFRPVLRGLLLTGMYPRYLRAEVGKGASAADVAPLWWPPAKIVGKHLAPFLGEQLGIAYGPGPAAHEGAIAVNVDLDAALSSVVARR